MGARELLARTGPKIQSWSAGSARSPDSITSEDIKAVVGWVKDPLGAELVLLQYGGMISDRVTIHATLADRVASAIYANGGRRPKDRMALYRVCMAAIAEHLSARACRGCAGRGEVFAYGERAKYVRAFVSVQDLERLHSQFADGSRMECPKCGGAGRRRISKSERGRLINRRYGGAFAEWYEEAMAILARAESAAMGCISKALFSDQ